MQCSYWSVCERRCARAQTRTTAPSKGLRENPLQQTTQRLDTDSKHCTVLLSTAASLVCIIVPHLQMRSLRYIVVSGLVQSLAQWSVATKSKCLAEALFRECVRARIWGDILEERVIFARIITSHRLLYNVTITVSKCTTVAKSNLTSAEKFKRE